MVKEALGLYVNFMAVVRCYDRHVVSTEDLSLPECYAMSTGN